MKKEFDYYNKLFDTYESILSAKERLFFEQYYKDDFSFQEIGENNSITRSAAHKRIKSIINKLNFYENNLHLFKLITACREAKINNKELKNLLDNLD